MDQLNSADIGIIVLILISTLIGIYRGFIREVVTVLTWIIGGVVAVKFGQEFGDYLALSESDKVNYMAGGAAIFSTVLIGGFILKLIICKALKITGTKPIDRVAGAVFGVARAAVIVLLVMIVGSDNLTVQPWYTDSSMIAKFEPAAQIISKNMPAAWRLELNQDVNEIEHVFEGGKG